MIATFVFALTLVSDIRNLAAKTEAIVGVAAYDFEKKRSISIRGDESFPMASVFKFPLAVEVLTRVDRGELNLDQKYTLTEFSPGHSPIRDRAKGQSVTMTLRELIRTAVSDSDNSSGDYLVVLVTPAAVTARMQKLGATRIRVDRPEKEIIPMFSRPGGVAEYAKDPRDTATPDAAVALLRAVYDRNDGLKPSSHDFLMTTLTDSANPVRIAKRLPSGTRLAHKTGTMPGTMNDIGIVTSPDGKHHIAIAILTKRATRATEESREALISAIAKKIYDDWAR